MSSRERITPDQIQALKQQLDLREIAAQFTQLNGQGERYGACPRCGGQDRFHVSEYMFFCRQCFPPDAGGGRRDVFDFAQFIGLARNFSDAYRIVADWANAAPSPVRSTRSSAPEVSYTAPHWQARVRQEMIRCSRRLLTEQGSRGREYLTQRGLTPETWSLANLGLAYRRDAEGRSGWAISLPWSYQDKVTALQYRFLAPQGQRYMRFGVDRHYGETILYTLPAKHASTLVVVEGEFNALSVWQDTPHDAVSFGSENMATNTVAAIRDASVPYQRVLVWSDKPAVTHDLLTVIGRTAEPVNSQYDANEQLQAGQLATLLA